MVTHDLPVWVHPMRGANFPDYPKYGVWPQAGNAGTNASRPSATNPLARCAIGDIRITTGADVIHAFAVPSFGIKIDAIPGRINETWFRATREGIYYGQCSELCGARHGFMPIAVEVRPEAEFNQWLAS